MKIRIEGVVKRFGAVTAVDPPSRTVSCSPCGKTTLLRLLAGSSHSEEPQSL